MGRGVAVAFFWSQLAEFRCCKSPGLPAIVLAISGLLAKDHEETVGFFFLVIMRVVDFGQSNITIAFRAGGEILAVGMLRGSF